MLTQVFYSLIGSLVLILALAALERAPRADPGPAPAGVPSLLDLSPVVGDPRLEPCRSSIPRRSRARPASAPAARRGRAEDERSHHDREANHDQPRVRARRRSRARPRERGRRRPGPSRASQGATRPRRGRSTTHLSSGPPSTRGRSPSAVLREERIVAMNCSVVSESGQRA